jgi:hypothetical protein
MGYQAIAESGFRMPGNVRTAQKRDASGGGKYEVRWQPKSAHNASALTSSLPDEGLDLTGLVGALERQPTAGAPRS